VNTGEIGELQTVSKILYKLAFRFQSPTYPTTFVLNTKLTAYFENTKKLIPLRISVPGTLNTWRHCENKQAAPQLKTEQS
jgi:hypothetical protein